MMKELSLLKQLQDLMQDVQSAEVRLEHALVENKAAEDLNAKLKNERADLQEQLKVLSDQIVLFKQEADELKEVSLLRVQAVEVAKRTLGQTKKENNEVLEALAVLQEKKVTLDAGIDAASTEYERIKLEFQLTKEAQDAELQVLANNLDLLTTKQQLVKEELVEAQQDHDMVRSELATRTRALDEREAVLKRREQKVAQIESRVQQNAALLNL